MGVLSMDKVQLLFQVTTQSAHPGNVTVDGRTQHGQSPAALPGNVGAAPAYVADDCLLSVCLLIHPSIQCHCVLGNDWQCPFVTTKKGI